MKSIIILGAGPAGVTCAIGLKKLGYEVIIISKKKPFDALEGFSQRTITGLQSAGCLNALKTIGEKAARDATWNNEKSDKNFEYIVERKLFDKALLLDAKENGIKVIEGIAKIVDITQSRVKIKTKDEVDLFLEALFIVDARGRLAPRNVKRKSKDTISFLVKYKKTNSSSKTSLSTSAHGWIWRASFADDNNYLQLTSNPKEGEEFFFEIMNEDEKEIIDKNVKIVKRESTSYCSKLIIKDNYIKIGDAACAVDPLSGNGVFQALGTALISPYVIHTLLNADLADRKAAKIFFENRVEDIFYRFARMGREFYALEKEFKSNFWKQRASWPDLKSYDNSETKIKVSIEKKAILIAPFIKAHDVVVTNDSPMGIWRLGRINLVYVVKKLLDESFENRLLILENLFNELELIKEEKEHLLSWCLKYELITINQE